MPIKIVPKDVLSLKEKEELCQLSNTEDPEKLSYKTIDGFDLDLTNLSKTKHSILIDVSSKIKKKRLFFIDDEDWFAILINKNSRGSGNGYELMEELKKN